MSHLRRYLEQTASVAPDRLEAALRRQQIYGGSLDTVLLELSVCDAQTLCELLGQACGLEVVRPELLEDQPRPWDAVPASLQEIGWAVPLAQTPDNVLVAVHPDLPNERLGELYRAVPRVVPLVTPECGLEKVSAERTGSVVPQRYAVLFASFLGALRQRPSVSDVGFPIVPVRPTEDTAVGSVVEAPPARPDEDALDGGPDPERVTQPYHGDDAEQPDASEPDPDAAQTLTRAKRVGAPSVGPSPEPPDPGEEHVQLTGAPPIRFTARGTMIATTDPLLDAFDLESARREVAAARSKLAEAMTRDEAVDALVSGGLVISSRVAVFRLRGATLHGLTTPHPALARIEDAELSLEDSPSSALLRSRRWVGTTGTAQLAELVDAVEIPCLLRRIDVAGHPALALYVDHEGREFLPAEANLLDDLCEAAADALERIVRHLRAAAAPSQTETPSAPRPAAEVLRFTPPPLESIAPPLGPQTETETEAEAGLLPSDRPTHLPTEDPLVPPPDYGVTQPPGWSPAQLPAEDDDTEPARIMRRPTQVDGSSSPRFVPPVLDEDEEGGIIPLSSPIDQPTIRGRITIDDEDFDAFEDTSAPQHDLEEIEAALRLLEHEEGDVDVVRRLGEPALRALAARLPGPLEVLRRDLRALPAPSAHGPLVRAAIRLGADIVPYALEQFKSTDPDLRFYAAFIFQELRDARALVPLSHLVLDGSTDVRVISMRVLETYSRYDGFDEAASVVRTELDSTHRTHQLYAARAVGTLRDVVALPRLIKLLSSRDRFIQEAALESLCSITGQQHGLKPHRWKAWHDAHGHDHRVEWIIESLRHRDLPVRRWAHDELVRVTGHRVPFSPLGDRSSREVAYQAWQEWWRRHGQARLQTRVTSHPS